MSQVTTEVSIKLTISAMIKICMMMYYVYAFVTYK